MTQKQTTARRQHPGPLAGRQAMGAHGLAQRAVTRICERDELGAARVMSQRGFNRDAPLAFADIE